MEGVAGVLHQLRNPDRSHGKLAGQMTEDLSQPAGRGRLAGADNRDRRIVIVLDGGPFAQELGLKAHGKIPVGLAAAVLLQSRPEQLLHRPRLRCGAQYEGVMATRLAQRAANLHRHPPDGR